MTLANSSNVGFESGYHLFGMLTVYSTFTVLMVAIAPTEKSNPGPFQPHLPGPVETHPGLHLTNWGGLGKAALGVHFAFGVSVEELTTSGSVLTH